MKYPDIEKYIGKNITVFGANRSGIAVTKLLHRHGSKVVLTDSRDSDSLSDEITQLQGLPIRFFLGGHEESCIDNAELIVVSPGVPLDIPILVDAKRKHIPILGELEVSSSFCNAPMVAITGTKGKTTTTLLTAAVLKESELFSNVVVVGNIGVPLASEVSTLTSSDIAIVEASSFQLESTLRFHPIVSVVLNLSRDHLDRHGTIEAYYNAKRKICENQTASNWLVLNAADPIVLTFEKETSAKTAYFTDKEKEFNNTNIEFRNTIITRLCIKGEEKYIVVYQENQEKIVCNVKDLSLVGSHNIRNILAAVTVGSILGVPHTKIRDAIVNFKRTHPALEHAFEKVCTINGVDYINDSKATNVISTYAALESVENTINKKNNRKCIYLIIGGYDKGNDYTSLIEPVRDKVKVLILLGEHTQNIKKAFAGCVQMNQSKTLEDALECAFMQAIPGDVVLFSPANASFDMFENYKDRGDAFKSIVSSLRFKNPKTETSV